MSAPPPLPPEPTQGTPVYGQPDSRTPDGMPPSQGPSQGAAPPPKKGLSGCAIAAIIISVLGVVGIALVAMLAAIAIPQYQDYLIRTRVAQIESNVYDVQYAIDGFVAENGDCPDPDAFEALAGEPVESGTGDGALRGRWEWAAPEGALCGFTLVFEKPGHGIDGARVDFRLQDDGSWGCDTSTVPAPYRRLHCDTSASTAVR